MNINSESLNFYKFVTRHTLKWDDLNLNLKIEVQTTRLHLRSYFEVKDDIFQYTIT